MYQKMVIDGWKECYLCISVKGHAILCAGLRVWALPVLPRVPCAARMRLRLRSPRESPGLQGRDGLPPIPSMPCEKSSLMVCCMLYQISKQELLMVHALMSQDRSPSARCQAPAWQMQLDMGFALDLFM